MPPGQYLLFGGSSSVYIRPSRFFPRASIASTGVPVSFSAFRLSAGSVRLCVGVSSAPRAEATSSAYVPAHRQPACPVFLSTCVPSVLCRISVPVLSACCVGRFRSDRAKVRSAALEHRLTARGPVSLVFGVSVCVCSPFVPPCVIGDSCLSAPFFFLSPGVFFSRRSV